jgi:TonB family protein
MRRSFWRNLILVALAHAALLICVLRLASASRTQNAVVWVNAGAPEASGPELVDDTATTEEEESAQPPEPTPAAEREEESAIATEKPTPPPRKAVEKPVSKSSPKSSVARQAQRKKMATASPGDSPEKKRAVVKREQSGIEPSGAGAASGSAGEGTQRSSPANSAWYGGMLHERFYRAWDQPTTVVASGAKLSALARVRIERDGRVSDFRIVRPSGNVVVDESVAAVAHRVNNVDAPPSDLLKGAAYEVNINFELNARE